MTEETLYCQRAIEGESPCKERCDHCKLYYAPLEIAKLWGALKTEGFRNKDLWSKIFLFRQRLEQEATVEALEWVELYDQIFKIEVCRNGKIE